jgi:hypothetical protein
MTEHTGYATVSGYHEFLYEPEKRIYGDLSDMPTIRAARCMSSSRDLFKQLGIVPKKPFVEHYFKFGRKDILALARDDRSRTGRVFGR